jgi:hypothetical protein
MLINSLFTTTLFLVACVLVVISSRAHINYIQTTARNTHFQERADTIGLRMDKHYAEIQVNKKTFDRTFAQMQINCVNDPSKICNQSCGNCVKRVGGAE